MMTITNYDSVAEFAEYRGESVLRLTGMAKAKFITGLMNQLDRLCPVG